ncbi:MAG: hypothetical protein R3E77_04840 [Steroidobacteraceae bacterium]
MTAKPIDLREIRQLMVDTHRFATVTGQFFLIWGTILCTAMVVTALPTPWRLGLTALPIWVACIALGWLLTYLAIRRLRRLAEASAPDSRLSGQVWFATGLALCIVMFVGLPSGAVPAAAAFGIDACVIAIGVFVNGLLFRLRWLRNTAYAWWAAGAAMLLFPGATAYWLFIGCVLLLFVVPGLQLNRMARGATRRNG